eukprot:jgi/Psemu1/44831/gm1.44831_g
MSGNPNPNSGRYAYNGIYDRSSDSNMNSNGHGHGNNENGNHNNANANANANSNANDNSNNNNNNNYHLRNPYNQNTETDPKRQQHQHQHQHQQQFPNQQRDSHPPRNPYARTPQHYQQQAGHQPGHQNPYISNKPNSYSTRQKPSIGSDITASSSSFAINPMPPPPPPPPPHKQQSHHQPPQQQEQEQQHLEQELIRDVRRSADLSSSLPSSYLHSSNAPIQLQQPQQQQQLHHQLQQQHQQQQQQAKHHPGSPGPHNEPNDSNPATSNGGAPAGHPPPEQEQLLEALRSQLDQSNESNFELEASVVTLEAELQHTRKTLTERAQQDKSKLEHELRLAQREAKRWKLLAQQQQQQSNQGRSIVSDTATVASTSIASGSTTAVPAAVGSGTSDAFSSRLLGNPAKLHSSKTAGETILPESSHGSSDCDAFSSLHNKKPKKENIAATDNDVAGSNATSDNDSTRETSTTERKNVLKNPPIVRLALNLLTQLEPAVSMTKFKTNKTEQKKKTWTRDNNAMITVDDDDDDENDDENGDRDGDDSLIRQVLLSIATSSTFASAPAHRFRDAPSVVNRNNDDFFDSYSYSPYLWTEGDLLEWFVRKSSFESADRYWSTLLLLSPDARKFVVERVAGSETGSTGADAGRSLRQEKDSFPNSHRQSRRKGRIRIRPVNGRNENERIGREQKLEQIRTALRSPWWDPNENEPRVHEHPKRGETANQTSLSSSLSSSSFSSSLSLFCEWVQWLSSSQNPIHLQTLRILLSEVAGRNGLTAAAATENSKAEKEKNDTETWWDLCYPSIAATIQRIAYRKLIRSRKKHSNELDGGNRRKTNSIPKRNDTDFGRRRPRSRIGKFEDRLAQLPRVGAVVVAPTEMENKEPKMDVDNNYVETDTADLERKYGYSKNEGDDGVAGLGCRVNDSDNFVSRNAEDRVFELALAVWAGLLQVASPRQLGAWYKSRSGIGADQSWKTNKAHDCTTRSAPPSNGLFMTSLLLDLFEELQFGQWMCDDEVTGNTSMSFSQILSNGTNSNINQGAVDRDSMGGNDRNTNISHSRKMEHGRSDKQSSDDSSSSPSEIPQWYNTAIAVLAQVGRTERGMEILRTRLPDNRNSDWMGNALDVSIRQLHTLVLHLDDVRTRHGSIVRLGECTCSRDENYDGDDDIINDDPHAARLCRGVEAWVRLWHQVLLFVQTKETISFRSLVLDLRDWFTSSCATLLTSEEIRPEIKSMIRWQLDELVMDEEDYEESKHQSR